MEIVMVMVLPGDVAMTIRELLNMMQFAEL